MQRPARTAILRTIAAAAISLGCQVAGAQEVAPDAGRPAPALELTSTDGSAASLAARRGRIVVLNFWATWCRPCRDELPLLESLSREYTTRGVDLVGASADAASSQDRIPETIAEYGVTFDVWVGATVADMKRFDVGSALPATVIVDRDGTIAFRLLGPVTESTLRERLEWLSGPRTAAMPAPRLDSFRLVRRDREPDRRPAPQIDDRTESESTDGEHAEHEEDADHDDHAGHDHDHDHDHDHGDASASGGDASLVPS